MKLRSLWVDDYRSLKELELTFPEQPRLPIALIAGVNGTGKSSILRALAHIFHALEYNQAPHIPFRLEYQIGRGTEIYAVTIRGDGHGAVSGVEFTVTKGDEPPAPRAPSPGSPGQGSGSRSRRRSLRGARHPGGPRARTR